ncbi:hypothetical protein [Brochothrix thermosphacta]|uniref:hypothetical protein n=1 Tax=Brochothrix thermosphacta TaxID=2756 RepID=UPI0039B10463
MDTLIKKNNKMTKGMNEMTIELYTEGSYSGARKCYGFAYLIILDGKEIYCDDGTQNNLRYQAQWNLAGKTAAVLQGLKWIKEHHPEAHVELHYSYEGVANWLEYKWVAKSILAREYVSMYNNYYKGMITSYIQENKSSSSVHYHQVKRMASIV